MDRETAIRKLRACLRLSKSSNENEAATAIRQAQALMREYGLNEVDANVDDIRRADATTRSRGRTPPRHVGFLAQTIAQAFQCIVVTILGEKTQFCFTGRNAGPDIAAYSFEVLRRQMERDAAKHTRRVRKPVVKRSRAEAFGVGWVYAVRAMLDIADLPQDEKTALDAHFTAHVGTPETKAVAERTYKERDMLAGHLSGRDAKLHSGVAGTQQRALGHGS